MAQLPLPGNTADVLVKLPLWKSLLDPVLANQLVNGNLIANISLVTGSNVINHLLSRMQVGWILTDQQAAASIYRSKAFNASTLTLMASAPAVVSIWCF